MSHRSAVTVLDRGGIASTRDGVSRVLGDHARCSPSADPAAALEPLSPARLAEDLIPLQTPGHGVPGHVADPWAHEVAVDLLSPADREPPDYARRDDGAGRGRTVLGRDAVATCFPVIAGVSLCTVIP